MQQAKIGAALPKTSEANGLHTIATSLLAKPEQIRFAVIAIDTGGVQTDYKFDEFGERYEETVPKARIRAIEPLHGGDADAAAHLMAQARGERLGRPVLPLDFTPRDITGADGDG